MFTNINNLKIVWPPKCDNTGKDWDNIDFAMSIWKRENSPMAHWLKKVRNGEKIEAAKMSEALNFSYSLPMDEMYSVCKSVYKNDLAKLSLIVRQIKF